MEHDKILKLVDECAVILSPDPMEGLKILQQQFKDEPKMFHAVLLLIAMNNKEHSEFILSYLSVGVFLAEEDRKKNFEDHVSYYPSLRELVIGKLDLIGGHLRQCNYLDACKSIGDTIDSLTNLEHDITIGTKINKATKIGGIHDDIKIFQKKLNRLSDFIVVSNQDKIIKEMAAIQSSMRSLEISVSKHIEDDFKG